MHPYRSHTCGQLRLEDVGQTVRLSGWVWHNRNLGQIVFLDLRDRYGVTQCYAEKDSPLFEQLAGLNHETSVRIDGIVRERESKNANLPTGDVEIKVTAIEVLGEALAELPVQVREDPGTNELTRLQYRFLDLRRPQMLANLELRAKVIFSLRQRMIAQGFLEVQTPILTASSPEGARDYLVPSRRYPGEFYALPQAPQIFKQLLMVSGIDRYFQIAPCFRDEAARADRSPGEFYQMDMEMSYVEQEDVFQAIEPVLMGIFDEFGDWPVTTRPFPRIAYADSMLKYASDKPDLRAEIELCDVTEAFRGSSFSAFASAVEAGAQVRALPLPGAGENGRAWFEKLGKTAIADGAKGMAWLAFPADGSELKGSIKKFASDELVAALQAAAGIGPGDGIGLFCDSAKVLNKALTRVRVEAAQLLGKFVEQEYRFCWVNDYPFYEEDEETGKIEFSHNPFSMPQGGMDALENTPPLEILAYQYDIVCNGIELSSGAIRNHRPDVMVKAFELAGYSRNDVETRFGGLFNAFQYGPPPHGGLAPGVDRIVMMLAHTPDIREVVAFPMTQQARDVLMGAPAPALPEQLAELHLKIVYPEGHGSSEES